MLRGCPLALLKLRCSHPALQELAIHSVSQTLTQTQFQSCRQKPPTAYRTSSVVHRHSTFLKRKHHPSLTTSPLCVPMSPLGTKLFQLLVTPLPCHHHIQAAVPPPSPLTSLSSGPQLPPGPCSQPDSAHVRPSPSGPSPHVGPAFPICGPTLCPEPSSSNPLHLVICCSSSRAHLHILSSRRCPTIPGSGRCQVTYSCSIFYSPPSRECPDLCHDLSGPVSLLRAGTRFTVSSTAHRVDLYKYLLSNLNE